LIQDAEMLITLYEAMGKKDELAKWNQELATLKSGEKSKSIPHNP
jgi:hypothetical protein